MSPTRPTTSRPRPRSRAPASTSASSRSSASAAAWTGACTPTTPTGANGVDPRNGGIVGTVSYDTTRNELDPQYAAAEDWQPGVSDVPGRAATRRSTAARPSAPCDANDRYELAPDGSYATGKLLNTYVTESLGAADRLHRPRRRRQPARATASTRTCSSPTRRPTASASPASCRSIQFGPYATDQGTPDANFGAAVNGNYGFGDGCFNGTLDATDPADPACDGGDVRRRCRRGDYLVHVAIPDDATGNPMYKVTGEEDINIGNGDQIVPQVPPPACAGALHTVDLAGDGTDGYPAGRRRRRPTTCPSA